MTVVTKEEALQLFNLEGPDPSFFDVLRKFQKLALRWYPTKYLGDPLAIMKFDRLCRSYVILTEGLDSIEECLTAAEMLDVFVRAFGLEDLDFNFEVTSRDASTQCDEPSSMSEFGASASESDIAFASASGFASASTQCTEPPSAHASTQCDKLTDAFASVFASKFSFAQWDKEDPLAGITAAERSRLLAVAAAASAMASAGAPSSSQWKKAAPWIKLAPTEHSVLPGSSPGAGDSASTTSVSTSAAPMKKPSAGTGDSASTTSVSTSAAPMKKPVAGTGDSASTTSGSTSATLVKKPAAGAGDSASTTSVSTSAAPMKKPGAGDSASTTSVSTSAAPMRKSAATEKTKQNEVPVAPAPSAEKLPDKSTRKASKKTVKRRQQRERAGSQKSSAKDRTSSLEDSSSEDEKEDSDEELDPHSAFVATALSRKAKPTPSGGVIPKVFKWSESEAISRSRRLAREGCELCTTGLYTEAVELFTQAIRVYPFDHSYFGNRSYCYSVLGSYDKALKDAEKAIVLQPQQAKAYFRRGKALLGLAKYSEAAESFRKVLEIEPECDEAKFELHGVCVFQIMSMGFTLEQAEWSATKGNNDVQQAINLLFGPDAMKPDMKLNPINLEGAQSLWVGNITSEVTEKTLMALFRRFGDVHSIRILHDRHCAFINYGNRVSPGRAMESLQGHMLCGKAILIRFPDNSPEKSLKSARSGGEDHAASAGASGTSEPKVRLTGPVNGNECYFWRTSGCSYGSRCRYRHIPAHKGIDRKPNGNGKFK